MAYKTYPDPRQEVKPDDSIYESEVDWEPRGEPYANMVLEMHEENQRFIDQCEQEGYFCPVCPWFDLNLQSEQSLPVCYHKDNPFRNDDFSCYPSGCPTGWLS